MVTVAHTIAQPKGRLGFYLQAILGQVHLKLRLAHFPFGLLPDFGSWIGLGGLILPGVTVGHGSIVAAGAVVDQDVPPNSHVAGNPAQVVATLPWGDR